MWSDDVNIKFRAGHANASFLNHANGTLCLDPRSVVSLEHGAVPSGIFSDPRRRLPVDNVKPNEVSI